MKSIAMLLLMVFVTLSAGCGDLEFGSFTPAAPENLTAVSSISANGAEQAILTWAPVKGTTSSNGATFTVYRGTLSTGATADKTKIASGITTNSYVDKTSAIGTAFYYQVTATIYEQESGASNEAGLIRQSSSLVTLTGSSDASGNTMSWAVPSGATSYYVYRGMTPSGSISDKIAWKYINAVTGSATFTDTQVAAGLTYYYQVAATYSNGLYPVSNEIVITAK